MSAEPKGDGAPTINAEPPLIYMPLYFDRFRRYLAPFDHVERSIFMYLAMHLAEHGSLPSSRSAKYDIAKCITRTERQKLVKIDILFDAKSTVGNDIRQLHKTAQVKRAANRISASKGGTISSIRRTNASSVRLRLPLSERYLKTQANGAAKLIEERKKEEQNNNGSAPPPAAATALPTGAPPPSAPDNPDEESKKGGLQGESVEKSATNNPKTFKVSNHLIANIRQRGWE
jgi:hypothetical protein